MKKEQWINEIKQVAKRDYGFTDHAIEHSDFECFWDTYGVDGMTPKEAMEEDMSYA